MAQQFYYSTLLFLAEVPLDIITQGLNSQKIVNSANGKIKAKTGVLIIYYTQTNKPGVAYYGWLRNSGTLSPKVINGP